MLDLAAGGKGYTVTVYEREAGGLLYARAFDPSLQAGRGGYRRVSLGHRDRERGKTYALDQAAKLREGRADVTAGANTLARLFNCREGLTPDDDVLPSRMHEGIGNGALKGERVDPEQFLAARRTYYEMAGWDPETGRPTAARLAELEVDEAAVRRA